MPSYNTVRYRVWCSTCKDWELFERPTNPIAKIVEEAEGKTSVCSSCGTPHVPALLTDIPKEKLLEQRERYKESKSREWQQMVTSMMSGGFGATLGSSNRIIESDAGQKAIDEARKQKEQELIAAYKAEKLKFVGVRRNDKCACGSKQKYKKCCWIKYQY